MVRASATEIETRSRSRASLAMDGLYISQSIAANASLIHFRCSMLERSLLLFQYHLASGRLSLVNESRRSCQDEGKIWAMRLSAGVRACAIASPHSVAALVAAVDDGLALAEAKGSRGVDLLWGPVSLPWLHLFGFRGRGFCCCGGFRLHCCISNQLRSMGH